MPVVKIIIYLFYVLAKPLAFCLDKLLGHELGESFSFVPTLHQWYIFEANLIFITQARLIQRQR